MMQVQKGQVKYKDRTDIICEYGIVDGKQYYFIGDGKLSNGNIIATTVLVEAIDNSVVPTSLGVIDSDGNVVIPFENRKIKAINDSYLLVERSKPKSESVIASAQSKNDPMTATKLVTSAATIKDNISAKMGVEGRFLFNDPTSEAAIYNIDGNNVIADNYYSFIGTNDYSFYFSKDVVGSPIVEYNYNELSNGDSKEDNVSLPDSIVSDEVAVPVVEEDKLDVSAIKVDKNDLESAINDIENSVDINESYSVVNEEEIVLPVVDESKEETVSTEEDSKGESAVEDKEEVAIPVVDESKDETTLTEEDQKEEVAIPVVDESEDVISTEKVLKEVSPVQEEEKNNDINDDLFAKFNVFEDKYERDYSSNEFRIDVDNFDTRRDYDRISDEKDYYRDYLEDSREDDDSIMRDVAVTMTELIKQNKEQRGKISSLESKNDNLENKNDNLERKIITFENNVSKLENKNQILESQVRQMEDRVHNQEDLIDRQNEEIRSLRNQLKGKKDLARLLETAKDVLEQRNYDYDDTDISYGKRIA